MTFRHVKAAAAFFVFDNAGVGACKEKDGREKGRTGTCAVNREGRSGTEGKFRRCLREV